MIFMKAWTLDSTGVPLRLSEIGEPQLRAGGALVQMLGVQIPAYTGALTVGGRGGIATPTVLGIGGIARVVEVADDVFNVRPGDLVVTTGFLLSGRSADPEEALLGWTGIGGRGRNSDTITAMRRVWRDGTFAERAVLPAVTLVALPDAQSYPDPARLAFLSWLSVAAGGIQRAGVRPGDRVAVIGASGQLGGAATLVALASGAAQVVAVGRNVAALDRLVEHDRRVIAVAARGHRETDVAAITAAGGEVDVVIDALGAAPTAELTMAGFDALRTDGTMVVMGGVREVLPVPYGELMRRRITLRGSWMAPPSTVLDVWRMVAGRTVDLGVLGVHTVGLDDPAAALELAAGSRGLDIVVLVP